MRHDVLSQQNAHPYAFRARQTNQEHQGGRIAAAAVDAKISLQNPFVVAEKEERKKERKKEGAREDISPRKARGHCGAEDANVP